MAIRETVRQTFRTVPTAGLLEEAFAIACADDRTVYDAV